MIKSIDSSLAQQIVDTIKDVCEQNINFIDPSGIILASTDNKRVGIFHEIGQKAAATRTAIEVTSDDNYSGTQIGINVPIYHNKTVLAVVGITGEPNKVRKYAYLAERISNLLIRERELSAISRNQSDKKQYIIDSLIRKETVNQEYLKDCLSSFHIQLNTEKKVLLIRINPRYNQANLALIETAIEQLFEQIHLPLYTFHYPNEYVAIIESDVYEKASVTLKKFSNQQKELLKLTVGKSASIYDIAASYQSAITAWKGISSREDSFADFDQLTLEILLSDIKDNSRETFFQKTLGNLNLEEKKLLHVYFEENLSLTRTSNRLFLHKNTIQYKLNHISEKCGLNPRVFQDAVLLYLGGKVDIRH